MSEKTEHSDSPVSLGEEFSQTGPEYVGTDEPGVLYNTITKKYEPDENNWAPLSPS